MSTISARIDDSVKIEAEKIAEEIGVSLSAAITVFLKRFIAERGFPFAVTSAAQSPRYLVDRDGLSAAVKRAAADETNTGRAKKFTYLDPQTSQMTTVIRQEP